MTPKEQAIATVRASQGLTAPPSEWTYEQRIAYNKALAEYILQNASQFTALDANTAMRVTDQVYSPLQDNGFVSDLSTFGDELGNQVTTAVDAVGGVGRGVLSTFKLAEWAIPLAAIAILGIAVYAFHKKQTA